MVAASFIGTILENSETEKPKKSYKEEYEEKNRVREERLDVYFKQLSDKYTTGDIIFLSDEEKYTNYSEICGILRSDIYLKRECGELFIKIPIVDIAMYVSGAHINNASRTFDIFEIDDYIIRLASNDDIEKCVRKYINEEIDNNKETILDAKKEIRRLKKINSEFSQNSIEEISDEIKDNFI